MLADTILDRAIHNVQTPNSKAKMKSGHPQIYRWYRDAASSWLKADEFDEIGTPSNLWLKVVWRTRLL